MLYDTFVTVMLITTPIWFIRTSLVELMVLKPIAETSCGWPMRNQQFNDMGPNCCVYMYHCNYMHRHRKQIESVEAILEENPLCVVFQNG